MATYAHVRHIELDKIGSGKKRITRPPGGESSDIFGSSPTTTPPSTPRKVKNYMASNIFTPEQGQQVKTRQRPDDDSFKRLFGANGAGKDAPDSPTPTTPKKNHQKSNIIFQDGPGAAQAKVNGQNGHTNGETNGHTTSNGDTNGLNGLNGHSSPINGTNGHFHGGSGSTGSISGPSSGSSTPSNGSINGDYKPPSNGHTNGSMPTTPSRRIPPGGYSTKLW